MSGTYHDWILQYFTRHGGAVRGLCHEATLEMVAAFPELRRACGFASWTAPNGRKVRDQHWWCVRPEGMIVDPTAQQFLGQVIYEELDLSKEEDRAKIPTGKCMDCGADVYNNDEFCNDACRAATAAFYNRPFGQDDGAHFLGIGEDD